MKKVIYLLVFIITTVSLAKTNTAFEQGNELYNKGQYNEALEKYNSILETNQHSSELYFNIANAHYKLNHIAPSVYYYEKALLLSPNDKEIKNNLAFANNMTIDAIEVVPEVGFSKLVKNATNIMSFDAWAKTAVALIIVFVVLFLIYYFSYKTFKKRLTFVSGFVALFFTFVAIMFAFHKFQLDKNNQPAIVFAKETQVKSEPNLRSQEAFKLHEGTKVQVLDTVNHWKKIKLTDSKIGWISSEDIKLLKNF